MRISDLVLVVLLLAATTVVGWEVLQSIALPSAVEDSMIALTKSIEMSPGTQQQLELLFSSARRKVLAVKEMVSRELVDINHLEEDLAELVAGRELEAKKAIATLKAQMEAGRRHEVQLDIGFGERMSKMGPLEVFDELAPLEAIMGGKVEGLEPFKGYSGKTWASQTLSVVQGIVDRVTDLRKRCTVEHVDSQFRGVLHLWNRNFNPDFTPIYQPTFAADARYHRSHENGLAEYRKNHPL